MSAISYKIDKRTFSTWAALMHAANASSGSTLLWLLEFPPVGRKRIEAAWHAGAPYVAASCDSS